MNEKAFRESRRESWEKLAELTGLLERRRVPGPDGVGELLKRYRRAASDLAEAQTHVPDSALREELELLVARAYGMIYHQPDARVGAGDFFLARLPQTFRANVGYFLFALGTFAFGCLVGAVVVAIDESWATLYLPPSHIEAVQDGQLWTDLFGLMPSSITSTMVFYNNAVVCFSAFGLGLLFGVGTIYVLLVNGLMLGSALALCGRYGLLGQLAGFIVGHGVLEISAILLAATGGLMLGDSLARPGRYRRLDALRLRARAAAILAVGALPFLAEAGFIEGFISPWDVQPVWKYALGITSGVAMYLYLFTVGRRAQPAEQGEPLTAGPSP